MAHDSYEPLIMDSTDIDEPNVEITDVDQRRTQTNARALYSMQNNQSILRTYTDAQNDGSQLSQHVESVSTSSYSDGYFAIAIPDYTSSPVDRISTLLEAEATGPGQVRFLNNTDLEWQSTVSEPHRIGTLLLDSLQLDDMLLDQSSRSGASQFQEFMSEFDAHHSSETSVVSQVRKKR